MPHLRLGGTRGSSRRGTVAENLRSRSGWSETPRDRCETVPAWSRPPIRQTPNRHDITKGGELNMWESFNNFSLALIARTAREEGQTLVEYAFLVAVTLLGTNLSTMFNSVAGAV